MKNLKRALALVLATACVICCLSACGGSGNNETKPAETKTTSAETKATSAETKAPETTEAEPLFPLKEQITFRIGLKGNKIDDDFVETCDWLQKLEQQTNIKVELVNLGDDPITTLNGMLASGSKNDRLDALIGCVNDTQLCELAYGGFLTPLEDYIKNAELMPNFQTALEEQPAILGAMTAPDGHIYSMARYDANSGGSLEAPLVINKEWLAKAGLKEIKTTDDLHTYLVYVRDHDMNGDGNPNDEVPLLLATSTGSAYSHLQSMLPMWGIATKDAALDSYTTIHDGKVALAPTTAAYKDAIKTIAAWQKEGLLWSEQYTANATSYKAKLNNEVQQWGAVFNGFELAVTTKYFDQLAMVPVPAAPGYTARVYVNPGIMGYKNCFTVFKQCENPEAMMAWFDLWLDEDAYLDQYNWTPEQVKKYGFNAMYEMDDKGNVTYATLTQEQKDANTAVKEKNNLTRWDDSGAASYTWMRSKETYERGIMKLTGLVTMRNDCYEAYKAAGILNPEIWPRPYFTQEVSDQIAQYRTDCYALISAYEAKWVTNQSSIDADWDAFQAALKTAGVEELTKLLQSAYDTYQAGLK